MRIGEIPAHRHDINSLIIFTLSILWVILCFFYVLNPEIISFLGPISLLNVAWIEIIALLFCITGLGILVAGFLVMGNSFRMGIPHEEESPADLIITGIFKYIRNPGFLGIDLAVLGTFLFVPSIGFGILLIASWISFHLQIMKEEAYLLQKHGEVYIQYIEKTGRYFPKLFR